MEETADQPGTSTLAPPSEGKVDFGPATYAMSRHRKNKVLVWQSRALPGRVYEFVLATRFRIPGVFSWKCLHCAMIKEQMRKKGVPFAKKKIPLVFVDNDVIKEDPDRPFNAPHFCEGRDVVDSTVLRTKLVFYDAFERAEMGFDEASQAIVMNASDMAPFALNMSERQTVIDRFDSNCVNGMHRVICRKRKNLMQAKEKRNKAAHEYFKYTMEVGSNPANANEGGDTVTAAEENQNFLEDALPYENALSEEVVVAESLDHDEYIDVEGDTDSIDPINV